MVLLEHDMYIHLYKTLKINDKWFCRQLNSMKLLDTFNIILLMNNIYIIDTYKLSLLSLTSTKLIIFMVFVFFGCEKKKTLF